MAYFAPNSTVKLCDVVITNTRQYVFQTAAAQQSFFSSHDILTLTENSYTTHDGTITLEANPETVKTDRYLMWINPTQENQYYYAKITGYKWINTAPTVEITYMVDWFQTYMFQFKLVNCQMDREQLSATDWVSALSNPFTPDILELQTPEDLTVGRQLEPVYEGAAIETQSRAAISLYPSEGGSEHQYLLMVINMGWLGDLDTADASAWSEAVTNSKAQSVSPALIGYFPSVISFFYWQLSSTTVEDWQVLLDQITIFGVTSEIIGLYNVSESVITTLTGTAPDDDLTITPYRAYEHPKLARAPFSYLRVTSPGGASKEYYYEDFASLRGGEQTCVLRHKVNGNGNPTEYIVPVNYGRNSTDPLYSIDPTQRIEWADMPQVGFNIDSFLTYLSSAYNSAIASNSESVRTKRGATLSEHYSISALGDAYEAMSVPNRIGRGANDLLRRAVDTITGAGGVWRTPGGTDNPWNTAPGGTRINSAAITQANLMLSAHNADAEQQAAQQEAAILAEANGRSGHLQSSALDYAKDAYIADEYHPGGNTGYIPYQLGMGTPRWTITRVTLEDHLADLYGDYLCRFGCSSTRFGTPYVYNYMRNSGEAPQWLAIDGVMATYAKTRNITVIAPNSAAEQYIAAIFQTGCLFVRGSDPTPPAGGGKA